MPARLRSDFWMRIRRARLVRIAGVYAGGAFGVLQTVDILTARLGLPDWFFNAALILTVIGLPLVVATALVQAGEDGAVEGGGPGDVAYREPPDTAGATAGAGSRGDAAQEAAPLNWPRAQVATGPRGIRRWLTWRRSAGLGAAAFGALALAVIGFMGMRALGIGPVGSLIAKGVFDEREWILIADFESPSGDEVLAGAVTEAFRVDFEQSSVVALVQPNTVREALRRMGRADATRLDLATARELAQREGIKAVVAGEVNAAGRSFVISVRLVSAADGAPLAALRESARDSASVIDAVDRLSKELRNRIGESLRTIRATEPLAQVSTPSLEALQKYSQAVRAADIEQDHDKAIALLEEAIALDSAFAMAHRKLGVVLNNRFGPTERALAAMARAYEYRDRLTDRERYLTLGTYYTYVDYDRNQAITAYRTVLDLYPDETTALNNLAILYAQQGDHRRAEELTRRALALEPTGSVRYTNLVNHLAAQGKLDAADSVLRVYRAQFPDQPNGAVAAALLAYLKGDMDAAEREALPLEDARSAGPQALGALQVLANLDVLRGRVGSGMRRIERLASALPASMGGGSKLDEELSIAYVELVVLGERERALRRVESALAREPLASLPEDSRPYTRLVTFYSYAGVGAEARRYLEEYVRGLDVRERKRTAEELLQFEAIVARAEGRFDEAIRALERAVRESACPGCVLPELALTYRMAGQADAAIAAYERYLVTPWLMRLFQDAIWLPIAHATLAELYEEKGDVVRAAAHYARLAELWADADPELQPRVESARLAAARLAGESTGAGGASLPR